jgi:hypothetical protein
MPTSDVPAEEDDQGTITADDDQKTVTSTIGLSSSIENSGFLSTERVEKGITQLTTSFQQANPPFIADWHREKFTPYLKM